jgi:hypothetical protein
VSYSDADGDGICEPGEEITFYGDPEFDYYDWDFDGDGLPDDNGEVVTYTFCEEGVYTVSVIETNGHTEQKILIIEVETDDHNEPEPDGKDKENKLEKKIEKILDRLNRNNVKINIIIKLLLKEYRKMERKDQVCFDLTEALKFINKFEEKIES